MATIKSYTDISQSKTLSKILPFESADMHWQYIEEDNGQLQWFCFPKDFSINQHNTVSAWSLASLLELLPKRIEIVDNVYELSVYLYGIYYWNVNNGNLFFKDKDSLVDACVDTIIRLNELNLL